jgi:hypothetical protein
MIALIILYLGALIIEWGVALGVRELYRSRALRARVARAIADALVAFLKWMLEPLQPTPAPNYIAPPVGLGRLVVITFILILLLPILMRFYPPISNMFNANNIP